MPIPTAVILLFDSVDANGNRVLLTAVAPPVLPCHKGVDVKWVVMNNSSQNCMVLVANFKKNGVPNHPGNPPKPLAVNVPSGTTGSTDMKVKSAGPANFDRFKYDVSVNGVLAVDPELEVQPGTVKTKKK